MLDMIALDDALIQQVQQPFAVHGRPAKTSYVPAPFGDIPGWHIELGTQTMIVVSKPAPETLARLSTSMVDAPPMEYRIINNDVLAGLNRLHVFKAWGDDWDAEGGRAPKSEVIDMATKVYSLLAPHALPIVDLSPDGFPLFLYDGKLQGELQVTSETTFDYYFTGSGPSDEDVAFDGSSLPEALLRHLSLHA